MTSDDDPAGQWRRAVHTYTRLINAYVAKGTAGGWDAIGPEPVFRGPDGIADAALTAVREANRTGRLAGLRELWPPAHVPFADRLGDVGQGIPTVLLLDDGVILARIGAAWEDGHVVRIAGDSVERVPDVTFLGRSPNRRYFAVATPDGVRVTDGWGGPQVALLPWHTGLEGAPDGRGVAPVERPAPPTTLVPFPDGTRVLVASADGVFVLTADGAHRLAPTPDAVEEWLGWADEKDRRIDVSMEHGAVAADGSLVAVGIQDGPHLVYDRDLTLVGRVGGLSEYPHHAAFSADGSTIAFNSCHFYAGATLGVPVHLLPGLETEPYDKDERLAVLDRGARVYAAVARGDEFIFGDANGYVAAVGLDGTDRWRHFVGSTVSGMDLSADGRTLVVATYAGWISVVTLDAGDPQPYQIGTGGHREERRWLFWRGEETPMAW